MATGLNSLVADTTNQSTTLPSWYDAAQQNLTSQAQTAAGTVPGINQTAVGGFANQLNTAQNPFTQGQNTLNQIATGAANPWITDTATGQVTPNTNTAMGGLFQAQNQQLNQLLPNVSAGAEANAIGSGQFGSLRGQTAVDKARGDALANLQTQQMQSALQNQSTGAQAASGLGSLGAQQGQTSIATGEFQQNAPLAGITDLANIINTQKTGSDISKTTQYSPLSQATGLITALGGTSGSGGVLGQLFGSTIKDPTTGKLITNSGLLGTGGIGSAFSKLFSGGGSGGGATVGAGGSYPLTNPDGTSGGTMTINPDGSKYITDAGGNVQYYNSAGDPVSNTDQNGGNYGPTPGGGNVDSVPVIDPSMPTTPSGSIDYSGGGWGTGDGYVPPQ
jgi:hypothetical protein